MAGYSLGPNGLHERKDASARRVLPRRWTGSVGRNQVRRTGRCAGRKHAGSFERPPVTPLNRGDQGGRQGAGHPRADHVGPRCRDPSLRIGARDARIWTCRVGAPRSGRFRAWHTNHLGTGYAAPRTGLPAGRAVEARRVAPVERGWRGARTTSSRGGTARQGQPGGRGAPHRGRPRRLPGGVTKAVYEHLVGREKSPTAAAGAGLGVNRLKPVGCCQRSCVRGS